MSLFGRILTLAARPGYPPLPLARPKGLVGSIARAPEAEPKDEGEEAEPLARAAVEPSEESKDVSPLHRASAPDDKDDAAQPLHRAANPETEDQPAAPLRRLGDAPSEDEAQPLRRAAETGPEEEAKDKSQEEAAPMRRAEAPTDDTKPANPLRRTTTFAAQRYPVLPALVLREAPEAEALTAENSPSPAANSAQPEDEPAMALRRAAGRPIATPPVKQSAGSVFDPPQAQTTQDIPERAGPADLWQAFEPDRTAPYQPEPPWPMPDAAAERPQQATPERPRVVIEQIDVSITEPASAGQGQADFAANLSRAIRSRYLGR